MSFPSWSYLLGLLFAVAVSSAPLPHEKISTLIDLGYSKYQGTALSNGVNQYLALRFAAPPTGDLRWRAPAPALHTAEIQDATSFGPICLGTGTTLPSDSESEDCLFVNIWAPANATKESKLPVWVYIQGGGYVALSNDNYNGTEVVSKGEAVLDTKRVRRFVNYRCANLCFDKRKRGFCSDQLPSGCLGVLGWGGGEGGWEFECGDFGSEGRVGVGTAVYSIGKFILCFMRF
jgi:hypothetical protein